jgi:hypothetical protein
MADLLTVYAAIDYLNAFANQNGAHWEVNTDEYDNADIPEAKAYVYHNKALIYQGSIQEVCLWLNHMTDVF